MQMLLSELTRLRAEVVSRSPQQPPPSTPQKSSSLTQQPSLPPAQQTSLSPTQQPSLSPTQKSSSLTPQPSLSPAQQTSLSPTQQPSLFTAQQASSPASSSPDSHERTRNSRPQDTERIAGLYAAYRDFGDLVENALRSYQPLLCKEGVSVECRRRWKSDTR
jgi:hypothetical protein